MQEKDSFLTIAYKDAFIHTYEDRRNHTTVVQSQIGYCTNTHRTVIGAKRYITENNKYRSKL
jgi:hypothetical protein